MPNCKWTIAENGYVVECLSKEENVEINTFLANVLTTCLFCNKKIEHTKKEKKKEG